MSHWLKESGGSLVEEKWWLIGQRKVVVHWLKACGGSLTEGTFFSSFVEGKLWLIGCSNVVA